MDHFKQKLSQYLFDTNAVRVSPFNEPFFYTTGKIGPFYINTHFLYGSEESASNLLDDMNLHLKNNKKEELILKLTETVMNQFETNNRYRVVMERLVSDIMLYGDLENVDYISGGERRDWFFSLLAATVLNKPHISIFKDSSAIVTYQNKVISNSIDFNDKNIIHICDLVTEASSFKKVWKPVIDKSNNTMIAAFSIVDRLQGGKDYFKSENIDFASLIEIDMQLFLNGLNNKQIDINQYMLVDSYMKDPEKSMKELLIENPDFLKKAMNKDEKTKMRATTLLTENYYDLPKSYIDEILGL